MTNVWNSLERTKPQQQSFVDKTYQIELQTSTDERENSALRTQEKAL